MFHGCLKRMRILLLLDGVFYKCQIQSCWLRVLLNSSISLLIFCVCTCVCSIRRGSNLVISKWKASFSNTVCWIAHIFTAGLPVIYLMSLHELIWGLSVLFQSLYLSISVPIPHPINYDISSTLYNKSSFIVLPPIVLTLLIRILFHVDGCSN